MITFIYILLAVSLILTIFCVVLTVLVMRLDSNNTPTIQTTDNIEKIKILLSNKETVDNIDAIIDSIIKTAVDRYMILNVNFNVDSYITKDNIDEMSKYVFGTIKMDLTDTMRDMIGLIHNVDTEEKLDEFLKIRIKMYILALTIKTNQTINE